MIEGIHHITALASDPQRNLDFYVRVLGLRLVKQTVNFDAPDVYHLYYGDESGSPGSILTFFPFPNAARGKRGIGEISTVAFRVPEDSLDYWVTRLSSFDIHIDGPQTRFGEQLIAFQDPDGMMVELVFANNFAGERPWKNGPVAADAAVRNLHGATFVLGGSSRTSSLLQEVMGFRLSGNEGNRARYAIGQGSNTAHIDIIERPELAFARQSAGSVHHIAWRVADGASQIHWKDTLTEAGLHTTEVLDRKYFQSVYFREPGGILFELATDSPGFTVDEPLVGLGSRLQLPGWLEPERRKLERVLPTLDLRLKEATHHTL